MAAVDPLVLGIGTLREITKSEFMNRETGQVEDRGRKATLLTRGGFLQFNIPTAFNSLELEEDDPVVVWLRVREWEFNGRKGTTLIFETVADAALANVAKNYA